MKWKFFFIVITNFAAKMFKICIEKIKISLIGTFNCKTSTRQFFDLKIILFKKRATRNAFPQKWSPVLNQSLTIVPIRKTKIKQH